jgi:putative aldouronate transport system permease protein
VASRQIRKEEMRVSTPTEMTAQTQRGSARRPWVHRLWRTVWLNYDLYLMLLPAIGLVIVFNYVPMWGASIAFKDFRLREGIAGSPWVGLKHFEALLHAREFRRVFRNTLLISLYRLIFQFPIPIVLAILIHEVAHLPFKRLIQTITYLPHFLSWVIVGALVIDLLSTRGIVNRALSSLGLPHLTLMNKTAFPWIVVGSQTWKEAGWSAIIYLAAISGIDPQLYEAAVLDGANKWQQTWHITLSGIRSTIAFIILLRISALLATDVEQILMLYSPVVYETGDVIGTYVYRVGLGQMKYDYTGAINLFQSLIGFVLLVAANHVSRRYFDTSMW